MGQRSSHVVTVTLYRFRYRDPLTGRWIKARYKATPEEIAARHAEWEIAGPAETRFSVGNAFNPFRVLPRAELKRLEERAPRINPTAGNRRDRMLPDGAVPTALRYVLRPAWAVRADAGSRTVASSNRDGA